MSDRLANAHKGLMRMRQGNPFTAALQSLAAACLNPEAVEHRGWFTQESVAEVCKAARDPQCHHETTMRLWTLLLTEIWARTFIDRRGVCITHEELLGSADEPLLSWDGTRYQPTPSPRPPRPSHRA